MPACQVAALYTQNKWSNPEEKKSANRLQTRLTPNILRTDLDIAISTLKPPSIPSTGSNAMSARNTSLQESSAINKEYEDAVRLNVSICQNNIKLIQIVIKIQKAKHCLSLSDKQKSAQIAYRMERFNLTKDIILSDFKKLSVLLQQSMSGTDEDGMQSWRLAKAKQTGLVELMMEKIEDFDAEIQFFKTLFEKTVERYRALIKNAKTFFNFELWELDEANRKILVVEQFFVEQKILRRERMGIKSQ